MFIFSRDVSINSSTAFTAKSEIVIIQRNNLFDIFQIPN